MINHKYYASAVGCVAALLLVSSCGSAPESEETTLSTDLTAPGASLLFALPAHVRFHQQATGTQAELEQQFSRFTGNLGYVPVTLSSLRMPSGQYRFASVMHKLPGILDSRFNIGLTNSEYLAREAELTASGFRVLDVTARPATNGLRYDALFVREEQPLASSVQRNMLRAELEATIAELGTQGKRPVRIHVYPSLSSMRYSATFVADDKDARTSVAEDCSTFPQTVAQNRDAGYRLLDLALHREDSLQRCTAVFVADSRITDDAFALDLTAAQFQQNVEQYTTLGYSLSDVEYYSPDPLTDQPRYAVVWQRALGNDLDSNLELDGDLTDEAEAALSSLQAQLASFGGRTGFLIEDLKTGNYLGHHINDPMYLASISKVPIAIAVLRELDETAFELTSTLKFEPTDLMISDVGPSPQDPMNVNHVGKEITIDQYIRWMINQSSTNATDRLVRFVTAAQVNDVMRDSGHVNLGEITSICELDKRIVEQVAPCVRNVACNPFERWFRQGVIQQGDTCLPGISVTRPFYDRYYATLANTATPLEFAKLWRRLLSGSLLSASARDYLFDVLDQTSNKTYAQDFDELFEFYQKMGGKHGGKRGVVGYAGMLWQRAGADGAVGDIGQYSISMFAEGFPDADDDDDDEAREHLRLVLRNALLLLENVK